MKQRFLLPNGELAGYVWGSGMPEFSSVAAPIRNRVVHILSGLISGIATWETELEFRGSVSLIHEVVHYLQDLTTGLGHSDYLTRSKFNKSLLSEARVVSYSSDFGNPLKSSRYQSLYAELQNELVFHFPDDTPEQRSLAFSSHITQISGQPSTPDIERPFLVHHLLEAEAVACVLQSILWSKKTEPQFTISQNNAAAWIPAKMGGAYTATISAIWTVLNHWLDWENDTSPTRFSPLAFLKLTASLTEFLVDLACAYPSASLVQKCEGEKTDYEPGIKLLRLMRALQMQKGEDADRFWSHFLKNEAPEAEKALLSKCEFPYFQSSEIYEDWARILSAMAKSDDNRILQIRVRACEHRLKKPEISRLKSFETFIENQIPIIYHRPGGGFDMFFTNPHVDPTERHVFLIDLIKENTPQPLIDLYFETGKFICPRAKMNLCKASQNACISGIGKISEMPTDAECTIRSFLQQNDFCGF